MRIKYRAHSRRNGTDYGEMPLLHVRLKSGKNIIDLDCLVDSGAGACVFNREIADALGIDLSKAPTTEYEAVGGATLKARVHAVQLQVVGFDDEWLKLDVGFIPEDEIPLLGQIGFFDKFEITFRTYRNQFCIERKKQVTRTRPKQSRN